MFDSKLISIYLALDIEEKRKLRKWLNSDFVNQNEDILLLFKFIDSRKKLNEKSVTKLKLHNFLYPDAPYNDLRIRHLLWLTTEVFESFIVYLNTEKESSLRGKILSKFYTEKGLLSYSNKIIEKAIDNAKAVKIQNTEYFRNIYDLGAIYYDINSRNNRTQDFKINESIDSFTVYTIVEVLKSACIVNTIQKVMEFEAQQYLLQPVLALLPGSPLMQIPLVRIYYNIYQVAANEDNQAFELFLKDIKENEALFTKQDLNGLYRTAINFCIKKSNQNIEYYTQKTFELYVYAIESEILIENNEINRFIFTNTIAVGIKLKEFEKIEAFIKKYSTYINESYRKNTIDYNTAKLIYAQKQHHKALKILLTNEFKDTIWNLNSKYLVLKILFETRETEQFEIHLKAFKIYVKRISNIGYHKTYFANASKALTILMNVYKKPEKFGDFLFPADTPDKDWFENELTILKATPIKKAPTNRSY
ncbi:MAG: hypothetical protein IPP60_06095 [Sphingobacteriales bacterium]|nr:hypothetical protein [Sphingobacteriales bacterium]